MKMFKFTKNDISIDFWQRERRRRKLDEEMERKLSDKDVNFHPFPKLEEKPFSL